MSYLNGTTQQNGPLEQVSSLSIVMFIANLFCLLFVYVTGPAKIDHVSAKKSPIFSVFAVS